MASPSVHTLPEHWTELNTARKRRQQCSEAVTAIRRACDQKCGDKAATECPSCYGKVLDCMRARYTDSHNEREWFTQRRAFLHELEGLFQDVKDGARTLASIEARIESEKEAWYRWVLRKYPEFIAVSDRGGLQDELRSMLDDPDKSREELVTMMLSGIGTPSGWPASVDELASKAAEAGHSAEELKKLYIAHFFMDSATGRPLEHAERYLEEYRASDQATLEDMMDRITADTKTGRNSQPQREGHQMRLAELRRAKTAFEVHKAQAKIRAAKSQASTARRKLGQLPPCRVCGGAVDEGDVLSCSLCQAEVLIKGGSSEGGGLTVYCSESCYHKGHEEHVATAHVCEAVDGCLSLKEEGEVSTDSGDSSEAQTIPVLCKACLDQPRMTMFCSRECARVNVGKHNRSTHGGEAGMSASAGTASKANNDDGVTPMGKAIEAFLRRENPDLEMRQMD